MAKNLNKRQDDKKKQSMAIGLGLIFGAAIGLLLDNLAIGVAIGLLLGVAYSGSGAYADKKKSQKDRKDPQDKE